MKIVWDEPKRLANLEKHGFDLADADAFEWRSAIFYPGRSGRFRAVGFLGSKPVTIVFARLGLDGVSVISMRPASVKERKAL